jgi:hypothetical protein
MLSEETELPAAAAARLLQTEGDRAAKAQLALPALRHLLIKGVVVVVPHRQETPPARAMEVMAFRLVSLGQASITAAVVVVVATLARGRVD